MGGKKILGDRFNGGKPKWSLVDFKSLEPLVRVLEHGEEKYGLGNWQLGLNKPEVCESLLRHIFAYLDGEKIDKESGIQHTGHMLANAMMLEYMEEHFPELDDRFKIEKPTIAGINELRNK